MIISVLIQSSLLLVLSYLSYRCTLFRYNRNLGKLGMAVPAASTAPPLNGSGGFGYEEEYSQVAYDPDVED